MKFNNNYSIGKNVSLGKNVKIGDRTVIYDNVTIGNDTIITNDCVVGEPLNDYYSNVSYVNPKTIIGPHSLIRSHSIIYAGNTFGGHLQTGHRVTIRESSKLGIHCSVGTLSDIQGDVTIGNYCRLHSNTHIGQGTKLGNCIFVYPYVVFTNDPTPPSNLCIGVQVEDYAIIATGAIIMPGIKIGKNSLVGAGSVVTRDVEEYALVLGVPAKKFSDIRDINSRENPGAKHYPWMKNFDRNMPWKDEGFDNWAAKNEKEKSAD